MTINLDDIRLLEEELRALPIVSEMLVLLGQKLPDTVHYHTLSHTDEVLHEAILFSALDGRSRREVELIAIAAAYHDAGFLQSMTDNEEIGAEIARQAMRSTARYSEEEIALVARMIDDTKLRPVGKAVAQIASTELSRYLLDADLSNLGREDFFDKTKLLFLERRVGRSREELEKVLGLITSHQWYSEPAKRIRQAQKDRNIEKLRADIDSMR